MRICAQRDFKFKLNLTLHMALMPVAFNVLTKLTHTAVLAFSGL